VIVEFIVELGSRPFHASAEQEAGRWSNVRRCSAVALQVVHCTARRLCPPPREALDCSAIRAQNQKTAR
jgi:hypothetical protein